MLKKIFYDYYLKGYYSRNINTGIIVGHGWVDMQIKLFLLRMKCIKVEVI